MDHAARPLNLTILTAFEIFGHRRNAWKFKVVLLHLVSNLYGATSIQVST